MNNTRTALLSQIFQNMNNLDYTQQADRYQVFKLQTNIDSFPYTKWFRGNYASDDPIIANRIAGWRPLNRYYSNNYSISDYPNNCFQIPPHTYKPLVCSRRLRGLPCRCKVCCKPTDNITLPP